MTLPKDRKDFQGQAILVIILVMAVVLTISLAVVSRSVTNLRISSEQEESARVFSVAEAGIEEALRLGSAPAEGVTIGDITATVKEVGDATAVGGGVEYVFPKKIEVGDVQTLWLVAHNAADEPDPAAGQYTGSTVEIYWGNEDVEVAGEYTPALVATFWYEEGGEFKTQKVAVDPNQGRGNSFEDVSGFGSYGIGGETFRFYKQLTLPSPGTNYALRLKLMYNSVDHLLGAKSEGNDVFFPVQGKCYNSCAVRATLAITRCVNYCLPYEMPLGIFDYALYSSGDLTK